MTDDNKDTQVSIPTIEVVCDGGAKRKMTRVNPAAELTDVTTGTVDMGKKLGGLWDGYATRDTDGVYRFTPVYRAAANNDNANNDNKKDNGDKPAAADKK